MKSDTVRQQAEDQAKETYARFIGWCKKSIYWIIGVFIVLALFNFGADGTGSQYNGEVYAPRNVR